ncbi:MAG: S24 family peptidase [Rubrivivax sp.]|nr:MAG: S24 family peptidase [Rubrivivax sp.]
MSKAAKHGRTAVRVRVPARSAGDVGEADGAGAASPAVAALTKAPATTLAATLRARLLERLRDAKVPEGHAQAVHLAGITGRAYQTTRRWIDEESAGLPDLASFRLLCEGVDGDPMWLLGLTQEKRSLREAIGAPVDSYESSPAAPSHAGTRSARAHDGDAWVEGVSSSVGREMYGCRARRMRGDEMEPEIADGDTIFIDVNVGEFEGHGTYLIACDGRELVRRLEYTVGRGLVVSCANPRYEPAVFRDAAEILEHGLQVLGRIEGVVQVRKFWRLAPGSNKAP